jgi:hypothetical protein
MADANTPTWFPAAFPVLFAGMWLFVLHLLARMGGWRDLAASYGTTGPVEGRTFWFKTARLGAVSYNSCLTFTAGSAGLRIAVLFLFRPSHSPLVIPWSDISATEHRGRVFRYVDLQFKEQPQVRLRVFRGLAEALINAGGNAVSIAGAA